MVEPAIYLDSKIFFYPLLSDLSVDISWLKSTFEKMEGRIQALVLTHFFGFPCNVNEVVSLCRKYGTILIEDCAHAYYGGTDGSKLGSIGHFSIASPRKFFPVPDGGILKCNTRENLFPYSVKHPPLLEQFKYFYHSFREQLTDSSNPIPDKDFARLFEMNCVEFRPEDTSAYDTGLKWFQPQKEQMSGSTRSKWLLARAPHYQIIRKRKSNYRFLLDGLSDTDNCRPLYPHLPDRVVPYVFPLILEKQPELFFHVLKVLGVPVWRWEDMAITDCVTSNDYRLSLIQLPCHQAMQKLQLEWIVGAVNYASTLINKKS
jgi:hypothetical protein